MDAILVLLTLVTIWIIGARMRKSVTPVYIVTEEIISVDPQKIIYDDALGTIYLSLPQSKIIESNPQYKKINFVLDSGLPSTLLVPANQVAHLDNENFRVRVPTRSIILTSDRKAFVKIPSLKIKN